MTRSMRVVLALLFITASPVLADENEKPMLALDPGGHVGAVWQVAFTSDNEKLVSTGDDKTVRVWDVATGQLLSVIYLPRLEDQIQRIYALALSPDDRTVAVGGAVFPLVPNSGRIQLLSLETGKFLRVLKGHDGIRHLAFDHKGRQLASLGIEGEVKLWNVSDGSPQSSWMTYPGAGGGGGLAFSPGDEYLLTSKGHFENRNASIWSVGTGQLVRVLPHKERLVRLAWLRDGATIVTSEESGFIDAWSSDGQLTKQHRLPSFAESLGSSSDSKRVLACYYLEGEGSAVLLDLVSGETRKIGPVPRGYSCALSPNGKWAAIGGENGEIALCRVSDGTRVHRLEGKGRPIHGVAWDRQGQQLLWGNHRIVHPGHWEYPLQQAFDLKTLQFATLDTSEINAPRRVTLGQSAPPLSLRDGRTIGFAGFNIYIRNGKNEKPQQNLRGHLGYVSWVAASNDERYLLSGGTDQTLRIWSLEREQLLLSLFFADKQWVAWTPEGYFAASPGGERFVGWLVGHGLDRLPQFYPAAQFHASLYRPDVIQRLLDATGVEKALELADRERGKNSQLTNIGMVLPPKVEIVAPALNERLITKSPLKVEAKANSVGEHPVTAMRVLVDGRPYEGILGQITIRDPRLGEVRESWNVQLTPGKHQIAVQVESAVSKVVSDPIEVTLAEERGLVRVPDSNAADPINLPSLYVLAVGISEYPGKLKLNYANRDAEVLAKTLETSSKALYRKIEVKLLTDRQATRKDILQGLAWLRKQMTQRDVAILMFAGHGAKDSDGNFYLLPVDVDTEDLLSTGVPGDQIKRTLAAIPGKVIVLLDACHSGAVDGEQRRASTSLTDDLVRDLVTDDYGVIVMCSAMGREFALESPDIQHGYFTLAIVEGLSGKADYNKDSVVHFNELDLYATDRVKDLAKGKQHPVTAKPTSIRSFPISKP